MPNTLPTPPPSAPIVAGVRLRPALPLALYALLVGSAGAALWAQRAPKELPEAVAVSAPYLFLLFAVGFAGYRFALVAAGRYSAFKAFFQVGVAAVFFMLLMRPTGAFAPRAGALPAPTASIATLLHDPHPTVRALAAELARHRPQSPEVTRALIAALGDADPTVREQAHASLVQLNSGVDLGFEPGPWSDRSP